MNTNTEAEYEYRVMVKGGSVGWFNPYGTRAYPKLGTARGLKSNQKRWFDDVRVERRPVVQEWEIVE